MPAPSDAINDWPETTGVGPVEIIWMSALTVCRVQEPDSPVALVAIVFTADVVAINLLPDQQTANRFVPKPLA